jgi:ABC-type polysaccharide/polyol phosphate export permease
LSNLEAGAAQAENPSRSEFVGALVERQIRVRSKRAVLGLLWPAIAPYFMLAIYVYVFHRVYHTGIPHYPVYLFAGLLPWTFFMQALIAASTSISEQSELVRRVPFPYELLPIGAVASVAVFFLANTVLFTVYLQITHILHPFMLLALVVPIVTLGLFTCGMAMIIALVDVYNRDLRQILANVLTIWFFLTPIVYSPLMQTGFVSVFKSIDPMQVIIGEFRDVFIFGHVSYPVHYLAVLVVTAIFFLIVEFGFRRLTVNLAADV